jgi:DNA-binding LytR/AlgR family response regulator
VKNVDLYEPDDGTADKIMSWLQSFGSYHIQRKRYKLGEQQSVTILSTDIAFIHLGSTTFDGFWLGRMYKQQNPKTNVVFLADSEQYATEAYDEDATDYLVYPFTSERFYKTLSRC